jgi:excisionase family DNA binding protein
MHKSEPFPAPRLTVTVPEAARATGLGRTTIYKLIDDGKLRRVKVGKPSLIVFSDLEKLIAPEDCAMPLDQSGSSPLRDLLQEGAA